METGDCTLIDREALMVSYLAGSLPPDKAEAFEAHYFGCDTCWRELEQGLEIRAAAGSASSQAFTPAPVPARTMRHLQWGWLAAAASVVLVASLWRFAWTPSPSEETPVAAPVAIATITPTAPVVTPAAPVVEPARPATPQVARGNNDRALRSPAQDGFRLVATREDNGNIRIEWKAVDQASTYVLRVHSSTASLILTRPVSEPQTTIEATALASRAVDEKLVAQVDAVNALGVHFKQSGWIELPARR